MAKSKKTYGTVIIGPTEATGKKVEITDYVRASYVDKRTITISGLGEEGLLLTIENLKSSGREPQTNILLTKESFNALIFTAMLYMDAKGEDIEDNIGATLGKESKLQLNYEFSGNLKPGKNFKK